MQGIPGKIDRERFAVPGEILGLKGGYRMGRMDFLKAMGAGMAVGAALGLCFMPRRSKASRRISRRLKLAGSALDGVGATLGF